MTFLLNVPKYLTVPDLTQAASSSRSICKTKRIWARGYRAQLFYYLVIHTLQYPRVLTPNSSAESFSITIVDCGRETRASDQGEANGGRVLLRLSRYYRILSTHLSIKLETPPGTREDTTTSQ